KFYFKAPSQFLCTSLSSALFPLTPTLSPGERENRSSATMSRGHPGGRESDGVTPSPRGEGRGERKQVRTKAGTLKKWDAPHFKAAANRSLRGRIETSSDG